MKYLLLLLLLACEVTTEETVYGNLYVDDGFAVINTANTFNQLKPISGFVGLGVDSSDSKLVIQWAGYYSVSFSISFTTGDGAPYHIAVFRNGIKQNNLSLERSGGSDYANASVDGVLFLDAGDELDIRVNSTGQQLIYSHCGFVAVKI